MKRLWALLLLVPLVAAAGVKRDVKIAVEKYHILFMANAPGIVQMYASSAKITLVDDEGNEQPVTLEQLGDVFKEQEDRGRTILFSKTKLKKEGDRWHATGTVTIQDQCKTRPLDTWFALDGGEWKVVEDHWAQAEPGGCD